jgi:cyclopropane-fatty-acyl-phospholipid synthase
MRSAAAIAPRRSGRPTPDGTASRCVRNAAGVRASEPTRSIIDAAQNLSSARPSARARRRAPRVKERRQGACARGSPGLAPWPDRCTRRLRKTTPTPNLALAVLRARGSVLAVSAYAGRFRWPRGSPMALPSRRASVPSASTAGLSAFSEPVLRRLDSWCLDRLATAFAGAPMRLQLWNGTSVALSDGPLLGVLTIADRKTLVRLVARPPDLAFGEAYASGQLSVQGDLAALLGATNVALAERWPARDPRRPASPSRAVARHNVHTHYDLGNDFYRLWLDDGMVYTCAYFERPEATLEEAQRAKLDYVCRKLQLEPGERVIEAGCGWGALALHMARHYGVSVRAFNVSEPQLEYARARARDEGLDRQVQFVNADYRSIDGRCDAFVSIGMLEHVGQRHYSALAEVLHRVLDPEHGRGLLHFIGRSFPRPFNRWTSKYIFPGAYAPALSEVVPALEDHGLTVFDVENLRPHYARTLQHWRTRFDQHADAVSEMFDDRFVRIWRLYLASAEAGFLSGDLQLFQLAFGRAHDDTRAWTRGALYDHRHHGSL